MGPALLAQILTHPHEDLTQPILAATVPAVAPVGVVIGMLDDLRVAVPSRISRRSACCENLARTASCMIRSLTDSQSLRSGLLRLRPIRAATIGDFARRTSSSSGVPANFIAWKKCSVVGQVLAFSRIGCGEKLEKQPNSPLTL